MNNFHKNCESGCNLVWAVEEMPEVHMNPLIDEGDEVLVGYVEPTRYLCVYKLTPTHEELRLENWEQVGLPESEITDYETLDWNSRDWSNPDNLKGFSNRRERRSSVEDQYYEDLVEHLGEDHPETIRVGSFLGLL